MTDRLLVVTCATESCERPVHAKGLCSTCCSRLRRDTHREQFRAAARAHYARNRAALLEYQRERRCARKQPKSPTVADGVAGVQGKTFADRMAEYRRIYEAARTASAMKRPES